MVTINKKADTFAEALGIDVDAQTELMKGIIRGGQSRLDVLSEILEKDIPENIRVGLLIEFGSRLVLDEATDMAEKHEEYIKQQQAVDVSSVLNED